jgi:hypothetical protein
MIIVTSSTTTLLDLIVMGLLGLLVGYLAVEIAARRSVAQPVDQDKAAEHAVMVALLASPGELYRVYPLLEPGHFTQEPLASLYTRFVARVTEDLSESAATLSEPDKRTEPEVDLFIEQLNPSLLTDLIAAFADDLADLNLADLNLASIDLDASPTASKKVTNPVLHYGQIVYALGTSRSQNTDRSPLVATDGTITRGFVGPSRARRLLSPLVAAVATIILTVAVGHVVHEHVAIALADIVVLLVVFASVELALVDFDTYYLDTPIFWPATLVAWLATVVVALLDHHPHRLLAGAVVAVAIGLGFEALSRIFAATHGGRTQGAGDTLIVVLTAGVPAALTGSWQLGLYSLIAGCLTAIVEWMYRHFRQGGTKETPIAFGPHLALGWVVAGAVLLALKIL